jgi:hypothetical protein
VPLSAASDSDGRAAAERSMDVALDAAVHTRRPNRVTFRPNSDACRCGSIGLVLLQELTFSFVLSNARVTGLFSGSPPAARRQPPSTEAQKTSASSGFEKQNTTTSLWSRRMEYVSGVAGRTPAAQNNTSRFTRSRTFSAGSAT